MTTNTASSTRIQTSWLFSLMSFLKTGLIKSSVSVELEVSTKEDSVDIDAESTMMTITPMRISGRVDSIVGTMES